MASTLIVWGWCGFGLSKGEWPELRLGLMSVSWCWGHWAEALEKAATRLRGRR